MTEYTLAAAGASPHRRLQRWLRAGFQDLMIRPKGNIPLLDVLRTAAIGLVFCTHFAGQFEARPAVLKLPFVYWGWTGVDLFFVLSGILIGTQLWKEVQKTGGVQVGRFLLRRGLRIWPLYFSYVAFLFAEVIFWGRDGSGLWSDATFLSNYFHCQLGGGWSLSTEEQFYIIAAVGIALLARKLKPAHLWIVGFAVAIPIISRAIYISTSSLDEPTLRQRMYLPIHTHSDGLVMGLVISWLIVYTPAFIRSTRWRTGAALVMLLLGAVLQLIKPLLLNFESLALIYGAIALYSIGLVSTPRVFRWHGFYLISRLSYGIYLNHFGLLDHMRNLLLDWRLRGGEPVFWLAMALTFLASVAISALTFQLIEWPFLQLRSRWLTSRPKPEAAAA
jgi:peptidoglycan/LPS O-acetylase OafA/YrhL